MAIADSDKLIAQVLRKDPHPPRTVDARKLRSALLHDQAPMALVYAVVGILGGVFAASQIEAFSLDDRWAKRLSTGTRVRVLLHPQTGKVLVPIGIENPPPSQS